MAYKSSEQFTVQYALLSDTPALAVKLARQLLDKPPIVQGVTISERELEFMEKTQILIDKLLLKPD